MCLKGFDTELPHNWVNRLLEGTNKVQVYQDPGEGAGLPQETEPDLLM